MIVRPAIILTPLIATAVVSADVVGFAATLLVICAIVGFAIAAAGWTVNGKTTSIPAVQPSSADWKSRHK
ncbi:hypothetical protein ABIF38_003075 [Bradyrhizobium japonicum]|uniref:Uncharacterized protein n=2 Tax=Bradyrhizobium elkanii TaxID=29448 RepID=A0ABV4FCF3_BRAEL|nr:hypothetical protein [Bradyrhizobium elkanii]MBP2431761.1 hypothetical protein [Bradyrhizobium elkanii]MBP2432242.1 hypothetical protein [Bradyrhizobium elkanii]MCP1734609.1 hypothetical protein [Bradyrhizobium elkanii]MCP1752710.1 hypothetical protein [Bradyrhizobium elkanii]MCP1966422.1 hypothetical protein [Bradyrhizobium elkanii]